MVDKTCMVMITLCDNNKKNEKVSFHVFFNLKAALESLFLFLNSHFPPQFRRRGFERFFICRWRAWCTRWKSAFKTDRFCGEIWPRNWPVDYAAELEYAERGGQLRGFGRYFICCRRIWWKSEFLWVHKTTWNARLNCKMTRNQFLRFFEIYHGYFHEVVT